MADAERKFWDLVQRIDTCMLTTQDDGMLRARPMQPFVDPEAGEIRFLTRLHSPKVVDVQQHQQVCLAFADPDEENYVSVSGTMQISRDRELIREAWSPAADAWFENGPDDPEVTLLRFTPQEGQYWDATGNKLQQAWQIARAAGSSSTPAMGESRKVRL